ncbi:glycosyltransferase [Sphingomonas sp. CJ20]
MSRLVAIVLPHALDPQRGGVQRVSWDLGHALAGRGWRVVYVSLKAGGHCEPRAGTLIRPDRDVALSARAVRTYLEQVFARYRPDVVVNQIGLEPGIAAPLWRIRRRMGFGVIGCFHLNPAMYRDNHRHIVRHQLRSRPALLAAIDRPLGWRALLALHRLRSARKFRAALGQSDRFMLLSPTFFDELAWYVPGIDTRRLVAIPNGVQLPVAPIGEAGRRNRLLFVGRMDQAQKNILLIPEIWARLQQRLPEWELHLVGEGPDRGALQARVAALGLERVHFHGQCDPDPHYRAARIFLMVSAYEGFGNTLVEAQARGCVPVAFRSYSTIDWILNDGVDAALVRAFDVDRLAETVATLAADPARLAAMRARAMDNARRFSAETMAVLWDRALHEVADQAAGAQPA